MGLALLVAPGSGGATPYLVEALPGSVWDTWDEQEYTWRLYVPVRGREEVHRGHP
jgi:hypothetical protein